MGHPQIVRIVVPHRQLVVPSPKGDLVSVAFFSRHFRAGLWILPSLPGLVCGKDLGSDGAGTFGGSNSLTACLNKGVQSSPVWLTTQFSQGARPWRSQWAGS